MYQSNSLSRIHLLFICILLLWEQFNFRLQCFYIFLYLSVFFFWHAAFLRPSLGGICIAWFFFLNVERQSFFFSSLSLHCFDMIHLLIWDLTLHWTLGSHWLIHISLIWMPCLHITSSSRCSTPTFQAPLGGPVSNGLFTHIINYLLIIMINVYFIALYRNISVILWAPGVLLSSYVDNNKVDLYSALPHHQKQFQRAVQKENTHSWS